MGMKVYIGKDGVAKSVKAIYVGVNGVAKCIMRPSGIYKYYGNIKELCTAKRAMAAVTIGNYALFGGGRDAGNYNYFSSVDAYNTSLTRTTATDLSEASGYLAAATIGNYALFAGGTNGKANLSSVNAYNTSLTRTTPASLSEIKNNCATATIGNYALFGGGGTYGKYASTVVDAYDSSLTRTTATDLSEARAEFAATTVGNYALFGGGMSSNSTYNSSVDAYNTSLIRTTATSLSIVNSSFAATTVGNYALFGGGSYFDKSSKSYILLSSVDAYDSSLTRTTATGLSKDRYDLVATTVGNYALFGGGKCKGGGIKWEYASIVDAYNASLTRTTTTGLSEGVTNFAATTVGNYALFGGGENNGCSSKVEAYYEDKD